MIRTVDHGHWDLLDGRRTLEVMVRELSAEYESADTSIEEDIRGLVNELPAMRIVVEIRGGSAECGSA